MVTRKLGPIARQLDEQPEAVVELVAALSDAALVAMGAAIRERGRNEARTG